MKINTMFYATTVVCLFPWQVLGMVREPRQIPACLKSFTYRPRPSPTAVAQSNSIDDLTFPLNQKGDTILHLAIRRDNKAFRLIFY
jgi:hypothetical protein